MTDPISQAMVDAFAASYYDTFGGETHERYAPGGTVDARIRAALRAALAAEPDPDVPDENPDPELINLTGRSDERTSITINRAEYEQAKADDTLDHLLDVYLSDMDGETEVVEPDGTVVRPYS